MGPPEGVTSPQDLSGACPAGQGMWLGWVVITPSLASRLGVQEGGAERHTEELSGASRGDGGGLGKTWPYRLWVC